MLKKSFGATAALFALASAANAQQVNVDLTTPGSPSVTITGITGTSIIDNQQNNSAIISAVIDGTTNNGGDLVSQTITVDTFLDATVNPAFTVPNEITINNTEVSATAAGNTELNLISFSNGSTVDNEAIVSNLQTNNGQVTASVTAVTTKAEATTNTNAALADVEIDNGLYESLASGNSAENYISGDFSRLSNGAGSIPGSANIIIDLNDATNNVFTANGNMIIANVQENIGPGGTDDGKVTSVVDTITIEIQNAAVNTDGSSFSIDNTEIAAVANGNDAANTITDNNPGHPIGYAIASYQFNGGEIDSDISGIVINIINNALVDDNFINMNNTEVAASANGNDAVNQIGVNASAHPAGAAIASIQINGGAVSANVATVGMSIGTNQADIGNNNSLSMDNTEIVARANGNTAVNLISGGTPDPGGYAIASSQINSGNIESGVNGVTMSIGTGDITGTGNIFSLGNTEIASTANGNNGVNSITGDAVDTVNFGIVSDQDNAGAITSSVTGVGISIGSDGIASTNTLIMNNTEIVALANGNAVVNSIVFNTSAHPDGASILSEQVNSNSVDADVTTVDMSIGTDQTTQDTFGDITDANVLNMDNTEIDSVASGNDAVNAINGGAPDGVGYTIESNQNNSGTITSDVASVGMSIQTASIGDNNSLGIDNTHIDAIGYGNNAFNSIDSIEAGGSDGYSITSNQINSGSVTATITDVSISIAAAALGEGNRVSLDGNAIRATAFGNSATNVIRNR